MSLLVTLAVLPMLQVYNSMKKTWGMCKECYGVVPAKLEVNQDRGATLTKTCPVHGEQQALMDPNPNFFQWLAEMPKVDGSYRTGMTALNVTNRCNVRCPGCYHLPDSSDDRALDPLIVEAGTASRTVLGLMGAEPTMREDLPELISRLKKTYGKPVMIYTNGIKLEDTAYVERLATAALDRIALSLHLPSYIGEKAYGSKLQALVNIKNAQLKLDHLAFSLCSLADVDAALSTILALDYDLLHGRYVRLRAPSAIGGKRNEPAHMSALLQRVIESCAHRGLSVEVMPFTNHAYAIMLKIAERLIMLVRWPTVEEIDLQEAQHGPVSALFVPEVGETQILHQVLLTEHVRSGKHLPPAPPLDCPPEISGRLETYATGPQ